MTEHRYEDYHRLLAKLCHRTMRRLQASSLPANFDDLMGEAAMVFVKADARFKPELGVKFSTYLHRAVQNRMSRVADKSWDRDAPLVSMQHKLSEDGGTLEDLLADEAQVPALDRIERRESSRDVFQGLSRDAQNVALLLDDPPPELLRELARVKAHRKRTKAAGLSAGTVKLDPHFICVALNMPVPRRRAVHREFKEVLKP